MAHWSKHKLIKAGKTRQGYDYEKRISPDLQYCDLTGLEIKKGDPYYLVFVHGNASFVSQECFKNMYE